jgi:hypothetical protein
LIQSRCSGCFPFCHIVSFETARVLSLDVLLIAVVCNAEAGDAAVALRQLSSIGVHVD